MTSNAVGPVPSASSVPVVTAGKTDNVGALSKFLLSSLKELLSRKTALNLVQKLDGLSATQKGLLDLLPKAKYTVPKEHSLWYRELQARDAETRKRAEEKQRRIAEIVQKGVRLTARDGKPVYTIDGKVFVYYQVRSWINGVPGPLEPNIVTMSDIRRTERMKDNWIKSYLNVEPAQVRALWKK